MKIYKSISSPSDRSSLQYVLDALHKWSIEWRVQFSIDKCQYLQIGYTDTNILYSISIALQTAVSFNKDLGFIVNNLFYSTVKPSSHITSIIKKANAKCMKCFSSRDPFMLIRAYKIYVRPLLEYGSPVWSPCGIGDVHAIESVQRSLSAKY